MLVFFREINEQSLVILGVNWFKNEGFWKIFTCTNSWDLCPSYKFVYLSLSLFCLTPFFYEPAINRHWTKSDQNWSLCTTHLTHLYVHQCAIMPILHSKWNKSFCQIKISSFLEFPWIHFQYVITYRKYTSLRKVQYVHMCLTIVHSPCHIEAWIWPTRSLT